MALLSGADVSLARLPRLHDLSRAPRQDHTTRMEVALVLDHHNIHSMAIGKDDPFVTMLMMAVQEGERRHIGVQTRPVGMLLEISQGQIIVEVHTN